MGAFDEFKHHIGLSFLLQNIGGDRSAKQHIWTFFVSMVHPTIFLLAAAN